MIKKMYCSSGMKTTWVIICNGIINIKWYNKYTLKGIPY